MGSSDCCGAAVAEYDVDLSGGGVPCWTDGGFA